MTSINSKLGLRPAGKRAMMQLPTDRALRTTITSAICPSCGRTGARLSKTQPGSLYCSWCNHRWPLPVLKVDGADPREPPPPDSTPEPATSVPDEDDRESDDNNDTSDTDEAERQFSLPGAQEE